MISRLYAIHDRAAAAFGQPILQVNDELAQRGLRDFLSSDQTSELFRYHGSYDLYHIGVYDTDTGVITPVHPALVAQISQLMP